MSNDSIGAMLTTLRNGALRRAQSVVVVKTKLNEAILKILKETGFVFEITEEKKGSRLALRVHVLNEHHQPAFRIIKRLSKPGLRRYAKASQIPNPLGGYGLLIISTPKGVMSGVAARTKGLGGELLCEVS